MRPRLALIFTLSWLTGCGGVGTEPQRMDRGALLAASCSGCHAEGGGAIAGLEGISATELEAKLLAYRDDVSGGSSMHRMARGYSDEQIALIARALGE